MSDKVKTRKTTETPLSSAELLEVADDLGRRIARRARWDGRRCTWEIVASDRAGDGWRRELAGGNLYQGSAGIALFLGELARLTGDRETARAAAGGLRHALAVTAEMPPASFAFHGGRVGGAYVAVRLAAALDRPELADSARALLAPLAGHEHEDHGLDVIAGAAGAIPALLLLRRALDDDRLLDVARGLGDHLVRVAHRGPDGWSWGTAGPAATRNLAGFAHGAAGGALALLELYRATGHGGYRFAAEMAFLYERRLFDETESNWPDLRHKELNEHFYAGGPEAVRRADEAGAIPPYRPSYMAAWCHGAPGIGLSRVRAFELTGAPIYRREAEAALATTRRALERFPDENFSLCHGVGGNCELPLYAAEVFADPALRELCLARARDGRETYHRAGRDWPCGTVGQKPDPSLLLGEAGIGYFYLRLAAPETPSVLLLRPPHDAETVDRDGFDELRAEAVDEYFGSSLRALAALGVDTPPAAADASGPLERSPVEAVYERLRRTAETAADPLIADATRLDRARYELAAEPEDRAAEYLNALRRPATDAVDWRHGLLRAADGVRCVTVERDWRRWLADGGEDPPPRDELILVLSRREGRIAVRRLGPFAAAVLACLDPPATLEAVVSGIAESLDGTIDPPALRDKVVAQLRELHRAGYVDRLEPAAAGEPAGRATVAAAGSEPIERQPDGVV